jgi:hypothetical protein
MTTVAQPSSRANATSDIAACTAPTTTSLGRTGNASMNS